MNALLDSISKTGDGKTPETSYLAVTIQEEYIFMSLRLGVKPKAQSLITQNGHFYDRLQVIDPKTNTTQYLWFNVDVQMNPDGLAVPNPTINYKDSPASIVVATAQTIAPLQPPPHDSLPQGSAGTNPTSSTGTTGDQLRQIAGDGAENCGEVTIRLRAADTGAIAAAGDCAERCLAQSRPFYVQYTTDTRRIIMGLVIDGYYSVGLTMGADGVMYQSLSGMENGQQLRSSLAPCIKPVQLMRDQRGGLTCSASRAPALGSSSKDTAAPVVLAPSQQVVSAEPGSASGQAGKHYTPKEQGFWSHPMKIGVTRTDAGSKYHFVVNFTVPDPTIRPNFPSPYPFNLITVYGTRIQNGRRVDLPKDTISPIVGDWKPGDPVRLEFELLKEYADPSQGWNLRFCIGSRSGCMPSSNLLLDSADAPNIERNISPATSCGTKAVADDLPPGVLDALNKAVKSNDFEEVIRLASQPESGLKVSWLNRNAQGKIVSYGIVSRAGCKIATMGMIVN